MKTFTKTPAEPHAAQAEAAGLAWLAEASPAVVQVIGTEEGSITIAHVNDVAPTKDAAYQAGRELARIHLAGAPAFGSPPAGWAGPNYIGTQPQECTPTDSWQDFYVDQRVLPFVRKAVDRGNLRPTGLKIVEEAAQEIRNSYHWEGEPARLHGDLWAGNLLFGERGPVFIDPAAHGGHPETDLAMLALFDAPYIKDIRRGYEEINPLGEGWLGRTAIHQLHPLAVHAVTHGPSYGEVLVHAAEDTLDILRGNR